MSGHFPPSGEGVPLHLTWRIGSATGNDPSVGLAYVAASFPVRPPLVRLTRLQESCPASERRSQPVYRRKALRSIRRGRYVQTLVCSWGRSACFQFLASRRRESPADLALIAFTQHDRGRGAVTRR